MSTNTNPTLEARDTSTDNANWGTLVIVLVLVIVACFIGVGMYENNHTPAPVNVTAPTSSPATP
jgi:hypothetical protein